jgi:hypothetical protein
MGNLFEVNAGSFDIYKLTPDGTRSNFASGLSYPLGLVFDSAGNLFEADQGTSSVYEFTPSGARSTFASGSLDPSFLAFQPVPEPSSLALLVLGSLALSGLLRRRSS